MKKILSFLVIIFMIFGNCFNFTFADEEILNNDMEPGTNDLGSGTNDLGSGTNDLGSGTNTLSSGFDNMSGMESEVIELFSSVPTFSQNNNTTPNLIISEVYFDGYNEWIEIYNQGYDFSGEIKFVVNTNETTINTEINQGCVVVFANSNVNFFVDTSNVFHFPNNITITDSKQININLVYNGDNIDNFYVETGIVKKLDNKNTSLQRFVDTQNITGTKSDLTQNISEGYFANPGFVFNESDIGNNEDPNQGNGSGNVDTGNINTGSINTGIITTPNLKITEIYFDGNNNWFEISNIGDEDFLGNLQLSGDINLEINTEIGAGISKVFANNLVMFQSGNDIEIIQNLIQFGDSEIDLDLIWSGQILDNIFVHESWVNYLQGMQSSVEKIGFGEYWKTTRVGFSSDRYYNIHEGFEANPTKYFMSAENIQDVTLDRNGTEIYTGSSYDLPIDCDDFWENTTANISEVYFGNQTYPSYVELNILDNISQYYSKVILSGNAILGQVEFNTQGMKKNSRVLLTDSSTWYNEGRESKYNENFQLKNTGFIVLYGLDWFDDLEILDIIYISNSNMGNSVYMGSESLDCAGVFDYNDKFSPGMTIGQSQFIQITPEPVVKYISVGGGGSCTSTETPTFDTTANISNEIQISAIKYYGNFQILKLKNKTNNDINLNEYYIQFLDGTKKNVQGNTLFAKSTMSFVGNYGLPTNQDFCVNLMKDGNVIDRYCRNSLSKATTGDIENIQNQMTFWLDLYPEPDDEDEKQEQIKTGENVNYYFKINNVIYDPEGSDDGNEEIWLTSRNPETIEFGTKFYITVNGTKKSLKNYGSISAGETKKLTGTFGFPNTKKTTINLIYSGDILDTYEYDPELDKQVDTGEILSTGDDILTGMDLNLGDIAIMSVLPNPFGADESGEEISLYYSGKLSEINLSSGFYLQIGTTKKYLKGILPANQETTFRGSYSLPNKGGCVEIGYKGNIFDKFCYEQPYEGQKFFISNGILESLNTLDLSVLNKTKMKNIGNKVCMTYGDQKFYCKNMPYSKLSTKKINQNKLYKEFFDSFENYMKSEWKIMYYDSEIKNYFDLLDNIEDVISEGKTTYELNGQTFQTSEFQAMYDTLYKKDPQDFVSYQLNQILPNGVVNKYNSLKQQYLEYLFSI